MKAAMVYVAIFALGLFIIPVAAGFGSLWGELGEREREDVIDAPVVSASEPVLELFSSSESESENSEPPATPDTEESPQIQTDIPASEYEDTVFKILDEVTGIVSEVSLRDFVRGAVAAEMPAGFHSEALKAQAVAAHTFALHNRLEQAEYPDPALKGADFKADPSNMKVYITEQKAKEFYGETYADVYWDKICEAADSVLPYIMEYQGEPIAAAYHAISAGRTEDAANVWSGGVDYLMPAESRGDYLAPGYEASSRFTLAEARAAILSAYPQANLPEEQSEWFDEIERSESGYILSANVGGVEVHGKDIRELFGLRSHNMDIFYTADSVEFVTYGYGHGVGLSQYGADFMARQGSAFDEILEHYYSGVTLVQVQYGGELI